MHKIANGTRKESRRLAGYARTATPCQSSRQKMLERGGVETISQPVRDDATGNMTTPLR